MYALLVYIFILTFIQKTSEYNVERSYYAVEEISIRKFKDVARASFVISKVELECLVVKNGIRQFKRFPFRILSSEGTENHTLKLNYIIKWNKLLEFKDNLFSTSTIRYYYTYEKDKKEYYCESLCSISFPSGSKLSCTLARQ